MTEEYDKSGIKQTMVRTHDRDTISNTSGLLRSTYRVRHRATNSRGGEGRGVEGGTGREEERAPATAARTPASSTVEASIASPAMMHVNAACTQEVPVPSRPLHTSKRKNLSYRGE